MSAPWTVEQREWLQAMGFDLLSPASAGAPETDPAPAARAPVDAIGTPSVDAGRAAAPAVAPDLTDPLMRALLRASRCDDVDALARLAGNLSTLRRDPAAKRALWPALRALRAKGRR